VMSRERRRDTQVIIYPHEKRTAFYDS